MILKREIYFIYSSLAGHFQNQTGHFWPAGMGLDGPDLEGHVGKQGFWVGKITKKQHIS